MNLPRAVLTRTTNHFVYWMLAVVCIVIAGCNSDYDIQQQGPGVSFKIPDSIRSTRAVNQDAVSARLISNTGSNILLQRVGDFFTGSITVDPGINLTYTVRILEHRNGTELVLAEQSGSALINQDTPIELSEQYQFPDNDGDTYTNLDERTIGSDPDNSISTPINIDGSVNGAQAGLAQFSATDYRVAESTGTVAIQVLRLNGSAGAVTASYEFHNETATSGSDFQAINGTLSWADGDSSPRTLFVDILADSDFEGEQTFTAQLTSTAGNLAIGNGRARITIIDSTPPPQRGSVQIATAEITTNEDAGEQSVTVERIGGTDGAISVNFAFTNATASSNDYVGSNGILNWADGDASPRLISFTPVQDNVPEETETFSVDLLEPTGGATLGVSSVVVAIIDATPIPEPGQLALSSDSYAFSEGTQGLITVARSNGTDGPQSVNYELIANTALAEIDYADASGTLNWNDGETGPRTVAITINSDNIAEQPETLSLRLFNVTGGATLTTPEATITIINDTTEQPGNIQLTAASYEVDEGTSVTVSAERINGQDRAVSASFSLLGNSASADTDFTNVNATLQWADGESGLKSVTITALTDTDKEANETATITLANPTGGATLLRDSALLTIIDTTPEPQPGTIAFTPQSGTLAEGQSLSVTVSRSGGSSGQVNVDYQTVAATAQAADFQAVSGTLVFADGDNTSKTIVISANSDEIVEANETFSLQLSNPSGSATLGLASLTLTITDNTVLPEPGQLQFLATDGVLSEGDSITVLVGRDQGSDGPVSVAWRIDGGTASASDHNASAGAVLNWADGDLTSRGITISATVDTLVEGNESLTLGLENPTGGAVLGLQALTLTITDATPDPEPGTLSFSIADVSVTEGQAAIITVTRNAGSAGSISVQYAIDAGGTASATDHDITSGTLTWADGDSSSRTITVNATIDALSEDPETVFLRLSNASGGASLGQAAMTLTIADNPPEPLPGSLAFTAASSSVAEGASNTISVQRSGGSDGAIAVNYAITGGTASGDDHTLTNGVLNWADGDGQAKTINFSASTDALTDADETIVLSLSNPTAGASLGTQNSHTITIIDDPPTAGTVAFQSASSTILEGSGTSLIVQRSGGSDAAVSVNYAVTGGSASSADYVLASGTLNWPAGSTIVQTINLTTTPDNESEADETVIVTLSTPTGGATIGLATHTVTITDIPPTPTPGTLALADSTLSVNEGESVTIAFSRTGGSDGAVSVDFSVTGTADVGTDHNLVAGTVNWADADSDDKTVILNATTDAVTDADETVILNLTTSTGGATLGNDTLTVTVADVPIAATPGELAFSTTTLAINEGESASLTVARSSGSDGAISVDYSITGGTAVTTDHTLTAGTLSWGDADAIDKTIDINAIADNLTESDETITITLSNATGGATVGTASAATVSIVDVVGSTPGELQFQLTTATVDEGASVDLVVERVDGTDGAVSVDYAITAGTAESTDHDLVAATLDWADGEILQTITLNANADAVEDDGETLEISLSNPAGGATLGADLTIIVTFNNVAPTLKTTAVDGLWQVCYESTDLLSTAAWARQYSEIDSTTNSCVKKCSADYLQDQVHPGWAFDNTDLHRCVLTTESEGSLAAVPVYAPKRIKFTTALLASDFSTTDNWHCTLQTRTNQQAQFTRADAFDHWLAFAPDSTYRYAKSSGNKPTSLPHNGVWTLDGRTLKLDRLNPTVRNVQFANASEMYLYNSANSRYVCKTQSH